MVTLVKIAAVALAAGSVDARLKKSCSLSDPVSIADGTTSVSSQASSTVAPATPTSVGLSLNVSLEVDTNNLAASVDVATPSFFKPGVEWQICIHYPIKHDSVDDLIPAEAQVWDIDLGHAKEYPDMIPTLKVIPPHIYMCHQSNYTNDLFDRKPESLSSVTSMLEQSRVGMMTRPIFRTRSLVALCPTPTTMRSGTSTLEIPAFLT